MGLNKFVPYGRGQNGFSQAEPEQAGTGPRESESHQCGWSSLAVGAISRDAALGLRLRETCRMTDQIAIYRSGRRRCCKKVGLCRRYGAGSIRAFLDWSPKLKIVADELAALADAHDAVVLAVAPAACGQACFRILAQSHQRRQQRQTQRQQQQDGKQSAHVAPLKHHWRGHAMSRLRVHSSRA